ncbi:helix-turn-helix domain-containing protein [Kordia sp.]|uniref:helix-turn-helix domain-containing protein n=1 Tax=Kordia sp. TaxID=1965332 RepID=UPI003D2B127A
MLYKTSSILLILSLFTLFSSAQSITKDSLSTKSFDELREIFYKHKNSGQAEIGKEIALYTLQKGKEEKNTKAITNSFIRLCRVSYDTPELALKYTDSCIYYATKYDLKDLLAEGYFYRGIVLSDMRKYDKSMESYIKALNFFKEKNDDMYYLTLSKVGNINLRIRNNEDALKIFKEVLEYENNKDANSNSYLNTLYSLSLAYAANDKVDSTSIVNKKGYLLALKNDQFSHLRFTHAEAGVQFLNGNYAAASDSLDKAIPYLKEIGDSPNLSIAYFYMGMISKDEREKISYYKKVDSIYIDDQFILPSFWTLYEELIDFYKKEEDLKSQLYYTERLLDIDTVLNTEYINIKEILKREYDIPRLIEDKESLIERLSKENRSFMHGNHILLFVSVCLILGLSLLYTKKKNNEKKFKKIIANLKLKESKTEVAKLNEIKRKPPIDSETLNNILRGIEEFEKNKDFLIPKFTLNMFAKKLETNSKYLSIIINDYKSQTFKNYINNLRVEYIVKRLYNDHVLRNYTISAIAKEAGFSSTESFTRAFNKKTELNVSYFLKKINH